MLINSLHHVEQVGWLWDTVVGPIQEVILPNCPWHMVRSLNEELLDLIAHMRDAFDGLEPDGDVAVGESLRPSGWPISISFNTATFHKTR